MLNLKREKVVFKLDNKNKHKKDLERQFREKEAFILPEVLTK